MILSIECVHVSSARTNHGPARPQNLQSASSEGAGFVAMHFYFFLLKIFFLELLMDLALHTFWNLFQWHSIVQNSLPVCIKLFKNSRNWQLLTVNLIEGEW